MFGKRLSLFLLFFFSMQFAQGQLSNFTLTLAKTNETCPSNGTLTFSVSNTTAGATMLYSVYLLPDTTNAISLQSTTTISGLVAGTYMVVATQSLGSGSGSQQQTITIDNNLHPLAYTLSSTPEICINDGTITVAVTNGTPFKYEIIAGPMTRPLQTSNVFTGLTAGVYQIRVFDTCNQAVVQTYTLDRANTTLNFSLAGPALTGCTLVTIAAGFQTAVPAPVGVIPYPLQVVATLTPPTGPAITYNQTVNTGNGFSQQVPLYPNQTYTYTFQITDRCGRVYNLNGIIQNLSVGLATASVSPEDCSHKLINFSNVASVNLVSAPAGYTGAVPNNFTPQISNGSVTVHNLVGGTYVFNVTNLCGVAQTLTVQVIIDATANPPSILLANQTCVDATVFIYDIAQLVMVSCPPAYNVAMPHDYTGIINSAHYGVFVHLPVGTYNFNVVDLCGNPVPLTITINPVLISPTVSVLEGCDNGEGTFQINGQLVSISLISAPAAYGATLPQNMTSSVISNGTKLSLDSLPPGNYVFQSVNACNATFTTTAVVAGYQDNANVAITPNCGSFNLTLNYTTNSSLGSFWLQQYDAAGNQWVYPGTNVVYPNGSVPTTSNSIQLSNNATLNNLAFSGHFRILRVFPVYQQNHATPINCFKVVYEFDFSGQPKINDVYSVSCGATFEVIVDAEANSAIIYRIISKDGLPFLINNGSSSVFSGLAPAVYVFEVEDACHNIVNSQFEVVSPNPMVVTPNIGCQGQNASLTVPNFSFLTYQWWKGNNTTNILSTTNVLNFPSFNPTTDNGTYHVRITYSGNPNSCLNQVLDYVVNATGSTPHAGNDNTLTYCGRQGVIDLSTLLTGNFEATGTWTEITASGTLTNNQWDTTTVPFAAYQFKYTVAGSCSLSDEALITITLNEIPATPTASMDPVICETQDLNLYATTVAGATYHWTGPNGFTSTLQNPTLQDISVTQNGVYTVQAEHNNCPSGDSSVTVLVNPLPKFTLNQDCLEREYQIWVTSLDEASYDANASTFSWAGPNNFTANQVPITITGGALGVYSLTITNQFGCAATNSIEVERNTCFIPNVITPNNDGTNESFDLTGFGVDKLEIYSRWGRKVYEKNNYNDEWHGQNMSGGILPDSTYYYIIKLNTEETKTGWIFLSRG